MNTHHWAIWASYINILPKSDFLQEFYAPPDSAAYVFQNSLISDDLKAVIYNSKWCSLIKIIQDLPNNTQFTLMPQDYEFIKGKIELLANKATNSVKIINPLIIYLASSSISMSDFRRNYDHLPTIDKPWVAGDTWWWNSRGVVWIDYFRNVWDELKTTNTLEDDSDVIKMRMYEYIWYTNEIKELWLSIEDWLKLVILAQGRWLWWIQDADTSFVWQWSYWLISVVADDATYDIRYNYEGAVYFWPTYRPLEAARPLIMTRPQTQEDWYLWLIIW